MTVMILKVPLAIFLMIVIIEVREAAVTSIVTSYSLLFS